MFSEGVEKARKSGIVAAMMNVSKRLVGAVRRGGDNRTRKRCEGSWRRNARARSCAKRAQQLYVAAASDPDAEVAASEPEGQPNVFFRVMACLPYLVPLMGCLPFGKYINDNYPLYEGLMQLFAPLLQAYYSSWFTPFLVFFSLFLLIVRNNNLPHFVRFNTMQSILMDICVMLGGLTIQYLPFEIAYSWIGILLNNLTYMTGVCSVFYCMLNILRGYYPDIPVVSEAVYMQVRLILVFFLLGRTLDVMTALCIRRRLEDVLPARRCAVICTSWLLVCFGEISDVKPHPHVF